MLKIVKLATRLLWREWRAGEWFVVFLALFLAITASTSIHFYTDRLMRGLEQQSAKFIGGDLVISSASPIPSEWSHKARDLQLRTAQVWAYPSVVSTKNQLQLINLQAVSASYPLLGDRVMRPEQKSIWVEPRLLPLLSVRLQGVITIGAEKFRVTNVLTADTDTLTTALMIAPRVLMRLEDVPATRTVLPGSRVDYRMLIVGEKTNLVQFRKWVTPQLGAGQRLLDIDSQQVALSNIVQRTQDYLQLVLLVCLMMSGVAIALSIQQYLRRHYSHVALWRCLGAKQTQIISIFLWQLGIVGLSAGILAVMTGYLLQGMFALLFKQFLQFPLPATGIDPAILGLVTSVFLLFAFAYPVIHQLPRTSPLYIWRNEIVSHSAHRDSTFIASLGVIALFIFWFMQFSLLTLQVMGILLVTVGFLDFFSLMLLAGIKRILPKTEGAVRRGLSQLVSYPKSISLQFTGFSLIIIFLITLGLVRTNLVADWEQSLPQKTPNYFAINIAETDLKNLEQFFQQHHVPIEGIYPMVRGRLVALNNKPILSAVPTEARNNNALHRELNLSWMIHFPKDNKIVKGKAWTSSSTGTPFVSVENKLAENLRMNLGDTLTFQIGDQVRSAVIANFRTLEWSSFHPNFFMIFTPGLLDNLPATYITSFHLLPTQAVLLNQLVRLFPNITIIDVASLLEQMQDLIAKITLATQYLFLFALGAGFLIFVTCLQASQDERRQTYYLLRVLGASKKYIYKSVFVEFGCLAISIAITAYAFSFVIVFLLQRSFFAS